MIFIFKGVERKSYCNIDLVRIYRDTIFQKAIFNL